MPASVKVIGDYSFFGCSNIDGFDVDVASDRFSSRDGILFSHNQDSLFICPLSKSGKYTVPSTVSYIGYSAFDGCTYLSEIIFFSYSCYLYRIRKSFRASENSLEIFNSILIFLI